MTRFGRGSNSNRLVLHTPEDQPLDLGSKPVGICRVDAEYNGVTLIIESTPCEAHGAHLTVKMYSAEGYGFFQLETLSPEFTWEHILKAVLKEVNNRLFQVASNQIEFLKSEDRYYVN